MAKVLKVRNPQMQVSKGWSNSSRLLIVQDVNKREVYQRLMTAVTDTKQYMVKAAAADAKKELAAQAMSKVAVVGLNI